MAYVPEMLGSQKILVMGCQRNRQTLSFAESLISLQDHSDDKKSCKIEVWLAMISILLKSPSQAEANSVCIYI